MRMDPEGEHLMVDASNVSVYANDDDELTLCRFDYERDKAGVSGSSSPGLRRINCP